MEGSIRVGGALGRDGVMWRAVVALGLALGLVYWLLGVHRRTMLWIVSRRMLMRRPRRLPPVTYDTDDEAGPKET